MDLNAPVNDHPDFFRKDVFRQPDEGMFNRMDPPALSSFSKISI